MESSSSITETQSFTNLKGLASQTTADLHNIDAYIEQNILHGSTERRNGQQQCSSPIQKIENLLQEWLSLLENCNDIVKSKNTKCEAAPDSAILNTEDVDISVWSDSSSFLQEETCTTTCSDETESFDESLEHLETAEKKENLQYSEQGTQTDILTVHQKVGKDDIVSEFHLSEISEDLGGCWKKLGTNLNIKFAKMDNINRDNSQSAEKALQLLMMWKRQEGKQATLPKLKNALKKIKRKDVADKLTKLEKCCKIPVTETHISTNPISGLNINLSLQIDGKDKVHICEDSNSGEEYVLVKLQHTISDHWDSKLVEARQCLDDMIYHMEEEQREENFQRQKSIEVIASKVQELQRQIEQRRQQEIDSQLPRMGVVVEQEKSIEMLFRNHLRLLGFSENGQNVDILHHILTLQKDLRRCENDLFAQCKLLKQSMTKESSKKEVGEIGKLQERQGIRVRQAAGIARFISSLIEEQSNSCKSTHYRPKPRRRLYSMPNRKKTPVDHSKMRNRSKTDPHIQRPESHPSISSPIFVTQRDILHEDPDRSADDSIRLI